MKKLLQISLLIIFLANSLNATISEQQELKDKFLKKIDTIISIVKDKSLSKDKRNSKIVTELTPMFDFELMAKLSLGKKWKQLNKKDRKRFVKLYVERMKKSYSSKLDAYSDEKVEITDIKQPKKHSKISKLQLITNLVNKDKKLKIIYKFYKPKKQKPNKNRWLIYDVVIEGISILKADKAQFRAYLQDKSIYDLMNSF